MSSKFSSSFFKKSPLNVEVATGYVSTRESLQRMFDDISEGTAKAIEGAADPQIQADRLDRRITSRNKRAAKKQKKANKLKGVSKDPKSGEINAINPYKKITSKERKKIKRLEKRAEKIEDKNINTLTPRYDKAKEKADSEMTKKLKQYEALYDLKNPKGTTYSEKMNQVINDYDERNGSGAFSALDKEERKKIIAQRLPYTD